MKQLKIKILLIVLFFSQFSFGQFYQGHQMSFGKNRIQFRNFVWLYYRYPRFDVYFYQGERPIAYYVVKYAQQSLPQIERILDYDYRRRIVFIVYDKLTDFKQSNIGLNTGLINLDISATTHVLRNKVFVYYTGDHAKLNEQVRYAISLAILREMLYGRGFSTKFSSTNLMNLPDWYVKGLASYVANPYDLEVDNYMRDKILSSRFINLSSVPEDEQRIVGHCFWRYIAQVYGQDVISNIIYFTRISKGLSSAFYSVLGLRLHKLNKKWFAYCKKFYSRQVKNRQSIDSADLVLKHFRKHRVYQQIRYNPSKDLYAYALNRGGRMKVIIYNPQTKKRKVIYRYGHRLEQFVDYSYPILAWTPQGDRLYFVVEHKGFPTLYAYELAKKKLTSVVFPHIEKIYSISFSSYGHFLVMSAMADGFVDLYVYNVAASTLRRLTQDHYDDLDPHFINRNRQIIFVSNRGNNLKVRREFDVTDKNDSLDNTFDVYLYNFRGNRSKLKRLTYTEYSNEREPLPLRRGGEIFLTDSVGIVNRIAFSRDSVIAFVDTAVHYKYFSRIYPLSNYKSSVLQQDVPWRGNRLSQELLWNKRYVLNSFETNFRPNPSIERNFVPTKTKLLLDQMMKRQNTYLLARRRQKLRNQYIADSVARVLSKHRPKVRDTFVDINNYTFEIERDSMYRIYYEYTLQQRLQKKHNSKWGKVSFYTPTFYLERSNNYFDYGQLVQSYQPFNGGPFQFTPGFNLFSVYQINEMFENYRILGGVRINNDLRSMEYIGSFEDLSKRLDKYIVLHRNAIYSDSGFVGNDYIMTKSIINEAIVGVRYPFSQVASVRANMMLRYDKMMYLATDRNYYKHPIVRRYFVSGKVSYVFDDTRLLAPNLYDGLRYKIWLEGYYQLNGKKFWTAITGFDFRFYKQIWRKMIFAWRLSGSTNGGSGKLVYYLGGVDNWYTLTVNPLTGESPMFDRTVNINYNQNYIFQAVATPLRGYKQNIRNGTTFLLMNTEVRLPIVNMLLNHPVSSDFLSNLQLVGFFDIGSAWCGKSPFDKCNAYNRYTYKNPPITVIVDLERPPFVAGYGFGVRTKILGYFVRFDFAWGYEGGIIHPMKFYLSLAYDF